MIFELIIAFYLVRYLRRTFQTAIKLPNWEKVFTTIKYLAILLLLLGVVDNPLKNGIPWIVHVLMLYVVYILFREKEFRTARPVLMAIAPVILLSLFSDIMKLTDENQFTAWKSLLNVALGFSVIWMIAMFLITNKQKKDLEQERVKTRVEEEQKKIMTSLKAELEIQVAQRTAELTRQKEELEQTVIELKSTQAQLIQSEKMASLGELTAGIAHEIQNPLNFVNNFSEINTELIDELKQEIEKGNLDEVKAIANDIGDNEQKINLHGKRADAIVKGMLQHSRTNSGTKEPTNINALADEYLRLAYHGLRAKDKSFNATMNTDFDETIGKINLIPQEIGRVILNLINNAFYAVNEKKKVSDLEGFENLQGHSQYEPTVWIGTRRTKNKVELFVKDNGNGIPPNALDKIFQPFFTTKPTGQGTGLGLSMSYDIVKAHGGELKVKNKEGTGAEFVIELAL